MNKEKESLFVISLRRHFKLRLLFHCSGLSALGAALYLQSLVLSGIFENGYFMGIEQNFAVLSFELFLTAFGIAYLAYLVWFVVIRET